MPKKITSYVPGSCLEELSRFDEDIDQNTPPRDHQVTVQASESLVKFKSLNSNQQDFFPQKQQQSVMVIFSTPDQNLEVEANFLEK
ncbi:hypothetical protein BPOR_0196g00050 [Botrytis porri]|uniref:Uncharacterized protein n=1 Tax=Botrytis porri TaxID=87229 RepID=A0A4Z1KTR3_9HELO|nr:hypothetical protein BPOR_0196g00050 [Botrytis porri]